MSCCKFHLSALSMITAVCVVSSPSALTAKTIMVGPDQALKIPSEAAMVASDGDTVAIEPVKGGYFDCAVWKQNNLTIEGKGEGVILTDTTCQGKAIFVIDGHDTTIRNLTFARARVPDGNGAGIRQEGENLHVEHSRFLDNENGILAAGNPNSTITIADSEFIGNGKCKDGAGCAHGIYINDVALLRVERSVFKETRNGHHIKSRALRTEIIGDTISDGPTGTASYLIDIPSGGAVVIRDNNLEKGPRSENHSCAIEIGIEGVKYPTPEIVVSGNHFTNDMGARTVFVKNVTATPARLTGNTFKGDVDPLSGEGSSN